MKLEEIIRLNYEKINSLKIEEIPQKLVDNLINDIKLNEFDPYWPKWDNAWWKIILIYELGLIDKVPKQTLSDFSDQIHKHYLHHFPLVESDLPEGCDPYREILCFCALGSVYQALHDSNLSDKISWAREWFTKYKLPDGGYNCDESAYTKEIPKSSVVSTLPMLETLLKIKDLTQPEKDILNKGVAYILERKLFRRLSDNSISDIQWLTPLFPRFYHYDILRGLLFVTNWAISTQKNIPWSNIEESVNKLSEWFLANNKGAELFYLSSSSLIHLDNKWDWGNATNFPLLAYFQNTNNGYFYLAKQWEQVLKNIDYLKKHNFITKK